MHPAVVVWVCVTMILVVYMWRAHQARGVLKFVVSHSRDDEAFLMIQKGAADYCESAALTLEWVNIPVVEAAGLTYMDALSGESGGFRALCCQCTVDLQGDVASHLSKDVKSAILLRSFADGRCRQPVVKAGVGFNRDAMLKLALTASPDRPAIVCLPWEVVDASALGENVTVERYSVETLLLRAVSDTIRTIVLPDDGGLDYAKVRALFTNVTIVAIGHRQSCQDVDISVWQDAYQIGVLAAALLDDASSSDRLGRPGNIEVAMNTKFFGRLT